MNTPVKERTSGDTPKSKRSLAPILGYSQNNLNLLSIIWTPTPVSNEIKSLIKMVGEARAIKAKTSKPLPIYKITHDLIIEAIEAAIPKWREEARDLIAAQAALETPEQLQKELAAAERAMVAAKAKMDAKMAALKAAAPKK